MQELPAPLQEHPAPRSSRRTVSSAWGGMSFYTDSSVSFRLVAHFPVCRFRASHRQRAPQSVLCFHAVHDPIDTSPVTRQQQLPYTAFTAVQLALLRSGRELRNGRHHNHRRLLLCSALLWLQLLQLKTKKTILQQHMNMLRSVFHKSVREHV